MANNLRKFTTESEYNSATLNYPSVSWITSTDTVHFDKVSPIPKKLKLTYSDSTEYDIDCDTATTLTQSDIQGGSSSYTAITSAVVGDCITSIGDNAFSGCRNLASIDIPSGVTSIGLKSFDGCMSLASVTIPNTVTSIGGIAFYQCSSLTSINIPSGVTSIGGQTFTSCRSLTSIDIPSGVTSIGNYAFENCSNLTSVTVNASTPPTLGVGAFGNTNNCPIYVPSSAVDAYKNATNWSSYASRIQAINE